MDAISDPEIEEIWLMKSAQTGATEFLGNAIGYHIDADPAPILLIQPTLEMAEAWSKDRLAPMLRDTPVLRGKVKDARTRDSGNTLLHKSFPSGHITMAGANSPAGLASRPIRILLCDEVDRFPVSAGQEGDPIKLAAKRTTTFWNRKKNICFDSDDKGSVENRKRILRIRSTLLLGSVYSLPGLSNSHFCKYSLAEKQAGRSLLPVRALRRSNTRSGQAPNAFAGTVARFARDAQTRRVSYLGSVFAMGDVLTNCPIVS